MGSRVVPDIGGHRTGHGRVGGLKAGRLLLDGARGLEAGVAEVGEDEPRRPLGRPHKLRQPRDCRGPLGAGAVRAFQVSAEKWEILEQGTRELNNYL